VHGLCAGLAQELTSLKRLLYESALIGHENTFRNVTKTQEKAYKTHKNSVWEMYEMPRIRL